MNRIDGFRALSETKLEAQRLLASSEHLQRQVIVIKFTYFSELEQIQNLSAEVSTHNKVRAIKSIGLIVEVITLEYSVDAKKLSDLIAILNKDKNIIAIIVQHRIPSHLFETVKSISPQKDVDGLTKTGYYKVTAVAESAFRILHSFFTATSENLKVAVIGYKGFVGGDITYLLRENNVKHSCFDKEDHLSGIRFSDIIISAVGKPGVLDNFVNERHIIIDCGFHVQSKFDLLYRGDLSKENYKCVKYATIVPGGMGPLSIATLIERILFLGFELICSKWTIKDTKYLD